MARPMAAALQRFVAESNAIEGISGVTAPELEAHERLLDSKQVTVGELCRFVQRIDPCGALLRQYEGMDVVVGRRRPMAGGPLIRSRLADLLTNVAGLDAYQQHLAYEHLHPFVETAVMDVNGRSGRALWLWRMGGIERVPLGFLHTWYYQSLAAGPCPP